MVYKLVYFGVRGRAMHIRYLMLDNGIEFEDEVITSQTWGDLKPKTIFGHLPILKDGDFELVQSNAILRYLARKHGLYGQNDREAAVIDMINDQQEDMRLAYVRFIYNEYDTGKQAYIESLPNTLALLEKGLSRNNDGNGFLVGNKVSFVDYTVFDLLDNHLILAPGCLDKFPKLKAFHGRMAEREKIASYRQTDGFKNMKVNGNGKQ